MMQLNLNTDQAIELIVTKLRWVVLDDPCAQLLFAIWERALRDAYKPLPELPGVVGPGYAAVEKQRALIQDARRFINSNPGCLHGSGVEPGYARRVARAIESGLPEDKRVFL